MGADWGRERVGGGGGVRLGRAHRAYLASPPRMCHPAHHGPHCESPHTSHLRSKRLLLPGEKGRSEVPERHGHTSPFWGRVGGCHIPCAHGSARAVGLGPTPGAGGQAKCHAVVTFSGTHVNKRRIFGHGGSLGYQRVGRAGRALVPANVVAVYVPPTPPRRCRVFLSPRPRIGPGVLASRTHSCHTAS